jgi:hypothetical protein
MVKTKTRYDSWRKTARLAAAVGEGISVSVRRPDNLFMPAKHLLSIAKAMPILRQARVRLDLTVNAAAAEHAPSGVGEEVVPGCSAARRHGPFIESSSA